MNNIAAVVVTYNRLELLKRCIESLQNQSCKDFDIIIVNNGSTDGTKEWIETIPDAIIINQENCGGAGGFYAGQKYAYDHNYEWTWMMDDDGVADENELKELLSACQKYDLSFANALVVDINCPDHLAFDPSIKTDSFVGDISQHFFAPYNGTIIKRNLYNAIGFIKKEMFIWGDEVEYSLRASRNGFDNITVIKAIHNHPQNKGKHIRVLPFLNYYVWEKPKHFSRYYYRNIGYIDKHYHSFKVILFAYIFCSIYYIKKFDFQELFKFWKYYTRGIKNNYSD